MIKAIDPLCRLCREENVVTPAAVKWDGLCARHWHRERALGRDPETLAATVEVPDVVPSWMTRET